MGISIGSEDKAGIIPILASYDATKIKMRESLGNSIGATCSKQLENEKYKNAIFERRFRKLPLYSFTKKSDEKIGQEMIDLSIFPFALVMPLSCEGNLNDTFAREGMKIDEIRNMSQEVGSTLQFIHSKSKSTVKVTLLILLCAYLNSLNILISSYSLIILCQMFYTGISERQTSCDCLL